MTTFDHDSDSSGDRTVRVQRVVGGPSRQDMRAGWWGYRVSGASPAPFSFWVLGADVLDLGDGYIQREAVEERLDDGRDPFECEDPHVDEYYDLVWNAVVADLRRAGHPRVA